MSDTPPSVGVHGSYISCDNAVIVMIQELKAAVTIPLLFGVAPLFSDEFS